MPTYQSPGVYVEEAPAGARPLEGVGTAVAAFIGLAESGPFNAPTLVSNWTQFTTTFGGFVPGSYLAQSVYGYFMNGGGNCYVVRIGQNGSDSGPGPARRPGQGAGRGADGADRAAQGQRPRPGGTARRGEHRDHPGRRRQPERRHVPNRGQAQRRDGRGVRPGHLRSGQAERGHHGQRRVQAHPGRPTPAAERWSGSRTARPPWSRRPRRPPSPRSG